jgi:hypothetical protein
VAYVAITNLGISAIKPTSLSNRSKSVEGDFAHKLVLVNQVHPLIQAKHVLRFEKQ